MKLGSKIVSMSVLFLTFWPLLFGEPPSEINPFQTRRQLLKAKIEKGIAIIQSTERNQNNLHEFFVPNSDNHDFIFLTGLEKPGASLLLCPGSDEYAEILYIDDDPEAVSEKTGIRHVYPTKNLLPDLSNAYSDYSLLRFTQRRFKPLSSELSRVLYEEGGKKVIHFNFPRFVNLDEPPPKRLELINRIQTLSPKYEIRDLSDLLDELRMYHDEYGIAQLTQAAKISGKAMIEAMRSAVPGMTENQLRSVFNFACHFQGAQSFGFPTSIRSGPRRLNDDHFPQNDKHLASGELITIDAGVEINHYSADIQRTFPVSGTFSAEQAKFYIILKKAQDACIRMIKPGVTMKDLQETAINILDEEGGYGHYFRWGTSHFLGMEVHDHGNNLIPFKAGICITVEPGLVMENFSIVLEDDVLCTEDGHVWLTEFIPREIGEIERIMKEDGIGKVFFKRNQ